jgi:hypothetical protein
MSETAKDCDECHPKYDLKESAITDARYYALSYSDAMHQLCVSCHIIKAEELNKKSLGQCSSCHNVGVHGQITENLKWNTTLPHFNNVILPEIDKEIITKEINKDEKENTNY